jgi:hypothetical protein
MTLAEALSDEVPTREALAFTFVGGIAMKAELPEIAVVAS